MRHISAAPGIPCVSLCSSASLLSVFLGFAKGRVTAWGLLLLEGVMLGWGAFAARLPRHDGVAAGVMMKRAPKSPRVC